MAFLSQSQRSLIEFHPHICISPHFSNFKLLNRQHPATRHTRPLLANAALGHGGTFRTIMLDHVGGAAVTIRRDVVPFRHECMVDPVTACGSVTLAAGWKHYCIMNGKNSKLDHAEHVLPFCGEAGPMMRFLSPIWWSSGRLASFGSHCTVDRS